MSIHRPPTSDSQRLENLLAAWGTPDAEAGDEEEEAALRAVDHDAWAREIQAKVKAHAEAARRARAAAEAEEAALTQTTDLDARIRAEVELAVAPYVGKTPPFVLAKLREIAERYFREHPQAVRILKALADRKPPIRSGEIPVAPEADETEEQTAHRKRKA